LLVFQGVQDFACALHLAVRLLFYATEQNRQAPSPPSSGNNSRRKYPDSSATSRFFAISQAFVVYNICISIAIVFLKKVDCFFVVFIDTNQLFSTLLSAGAFTLLLVFVVFSF